MLKKVLSLLLGIVFILTMAGCADSEPVASSEKPEAGAAKLLVGVPPSVASYPSVYMAEGKAGDLKVDLKGWKTSEQLMGMVTAKQLHVSSAPIHLAATLYNKGVNVKLVNVSVWGCMYVLSSDPSVKSISDLKGKTIAVSGYDLPFKHLLVKNGLNPDADVDLVNLDLPETSVKLASGDVKYALLNEPSASIAVMNAKKNGVNVQRVIDIQDEWGKMTGQDVGRFPHSGIIVIDDSDITPEQVQAFEKAYEAAAQLMNEHPEDAGPIVEKHINWMKAPAVQASLEHGRLQPTPVSECHQEVEDFFKEITKTIPLETFGGKIPDDGFYFQG